MIDRASSNVSVIDLLDRVLDKGIVIDASVRVSVVGIDLVGVDVRVVVSSIATYLTYAPGLHDGAPASRPTETERRAYLPLGKQLRHLREELERDDYDPRLRRRAEDRLLERLTRSRRH